MKNKQRAYLEMHVAIFLFGFTAIFGKLISLQEVALVWNRLWIALLGLLFIPGVIAGIRAIKKINILRFSGIGVLVALHWLTFYGSIKIGNNASVTLACFATISLWTAILEPLIIRSKFQWLELILGCFVILGIYFLTGVGEFYYKAIIVGLISAFIAALFSVLNKKWITGQNTISVSVIELGAGFLFISLTYPLIISILPQQEWFPLNTDWLWLILLGLVCTSLAYVLSLKSLKELSAFIANLSINLEPVYGIILAIFIFKENKELNFNFYLGTLIILLSVVLYPIIIRMQGRYRRIKQ